MTPINQDVVVAYYERIRAISEATGIPVPEDWFSTLLRMPDVMTKNDIQELTEEEWKAVHATVLQAIQSLVDFRKQEGAALEKKFREKIANISNLLITVEPYEKERIEKIKERITDALEKTISVDYDKNRLEQELIYHIENWTSMRKTTSQQSPEILHQHDGRWKRARQEVRFHRSGNGTRDQYTWQ